MEAPGHAFEARSLPPSHSTFMQLKAKFDEIEARLSEARQIALQALPSQPTDESSVFNSGGDDAYQPEDGMDGLERMLDFDADWWRDSDMLGDVDLLFDAGQAPSLAGLDSIRPNATRLVEPGRNVQQGAQPSCFCHDILEMEGSVRYKLLTQSLDPNQTQHSLDSLVRRMLYLLVSDKYWRGDRTWYFETLAFEKLAPITRYRIAPTVENYQAIQPEFRPTLLQMTKFHWPMVDWVPFPGVRDRLIIHGDQINLTDVILTSMRCYCLEIDLDTLNDHSSVSVATERSTADADSTTNLAYFRLTEYIDYVTQRQLTNSDARGKVPKSVEAEFVLALRRVNQTFRLERCFFDAFPLLYCEEAVAQGQYKPLVAS